MATPPEREAVALWRAWLKRLRQRFQDTAKSYLSDHDGASIDLALFHCDQRFASLGESQRNCVARDFIGAWETYRLGCPRTKKTRGVPTTPICSLQSYWHTRHSKQPLVWRSLYSNEPLPDRSEMEREKLTFKEFGERRRRFRTIFDALVGDASRCLKNLPFDWKGRIAEEAVNSGSDQRWLYCLFDVAWGSSSGLLNAERQFYFEPGNVSVSYESGAYDHLREWVRRHGGEEDGRTGNIIPSSLPVEWKGRLPECYFSILRDFYGQSVAFVDWLLAVERTTRDADARGSEAKGQSENSGDLEKRKALLEKNQTKPAKPLTEQQKIRKQEVQFCCPRTRKGDTWQEISEAYEEMLSEDKKKKKRKMLNDDDANDGSLRLMHDRWCETCKRREYFRYRGIKSTDG